MSNDAQALISHMLSNTFTSTDMYQRLGILRECVETSLFTESGKTLLEECELFLSHQDDTDDVRAVRDWGESVFQSFTRSNLSEKMSKLHEILESLPLLSLYIPVVFPDKEIVSIGQWLRTNCDQSLVLDIHIEPGVTGGCAFVWNDIYHELSFHSKVKEQPGVITEVLSGYANK